MLSTRKYLYGHELPTEERDTFEYLSDEEFMGNYFFQHEGRWFDFHDISGIHDYLAYDAWLRANDAIGRDNGYHPALHNQAVNEMRCESV